MMVMKMILKFVLLMVMFQVKAEWKCFMGVSGEQFVMIFLMQMMLMSYVVSLVTLEVPQHLSVHLVKAPPHNQYGWIILHAQEMKKIYHPALIL